VIAPTYTALEARDEASPLSQDVSVALRPAMGCRQSATGHGGTSRGTIHAYPKTFFLGKLLH
jgi:hypothetical protein